MTQDFQTYAWHHPPQAGETDDQWVERALRENEGEARAALSWVKSRLAERQSQQDNNPMVYRSPKGALVKFPAKDLPQFLAEHGLDYAGFIQMSNGETETYRGWSCPGQDPKWRKIKAQKALSAQALTEKYGYAHTEQSMVGAFRGLGEHPAPSPAPAAKPPEPTVTWTPGMHIK
jgi:hypothetical protein